MGHNFYQRREWTELRYKVLRKYGFKCMACKNSNEQIHVDHIKPISIYPELALNENNLQVLCKNCNFGKSNCFVDDLRPEVSVGNSIIISKPSEPNNKSQKPLLFMLSKKERRECALRRLVGYLAKKSHSFKTEMNNRVDSPIEQTRLMLEYLGIQRTTCCLSEKI